jgi:membrane-associated phospholipid phosphatase
VSKSGSGAKTAAKTVERADRQLTNEAAANRDTAPVRFASFLGEVADQPQLITASIATMAAGLVGRRPDMVRGGARMLAAHLVATGVKSAIKHSIDRTRPAKAMADGDHRFEPGDSHDHDLSSFPSGHTAGAVAVARAVSREIDGAATPAGLGVAAVAAIQPVAGNHYLSDVLVGGVIGWVSEALVDALFNRVVPPSASRVEPLQG